VKCLFLFFGLYPFFVVKDALIFSSSDSICFCVTPRRAWHLGEAMPFDDARGQFIQSRNDFCLFIFGQSSCSTGSFFRANRKFDQRAIEAASRPFQPYVPPRRARIEIRGGRRRIRLGVGRLRFGSVSDSLEALLSECINSSVGGGGVVAAEAVPRIAASVFMALNAQCR